MKICIAGKNNIAVNAVIYIIENNLIDKENLFIIHNDGDLGKDTWQKSLKKYAVENKLQMVNLEDIYNLKDLLFISLEFDQIIKTKKFKSNRLFNIHFSKLPAYKGMYTSTLPILNGEKESGVTLHLIDDGIDTGDIVEQIEFNIDINDTARDLYFKYNKFGFGLFKKNIRKILKGNFQAKKQLNIGSTYFQKNSLNYSNIEIDFNKTAFEIHNQIRAYIFKEYQLPKIKGSRIKKSILTDEIMENPRQIVENKDRFEISGIDRYVVIIYKE